MNAKSIAIVTALLVTASSSALAQWDPYPYAWRYRRPYVGGPYYGATVYGSYLHGWADLERAWGERELNHWQARVFAEQARERSIYNWQLYRQVRMEDYLYRNELRRQRIFDKALARIEKRKAEHAATTEAARDLVDQIQSHAHQWPAALERREFRYETAKIEAVLGDWPSDGEAANWRQRQALKDLAKRLRDVLSAKNPYHLTFAERVHAMETVCQLEALAAGDEDPGIVRAAAKAGLPGVG